MTEQVHALLASDGAAVRYSQMGRLDDVAIPRVCGEPGSDWLSVDFGKAAATSAWAM